VGGSRIGAAADVHHYPKGTRHPDPWWESGGVGTQMEMEMEMGLRLHSDVVARLRLKLLLSHQRLAKGDKAIGGAYF